MATVLGAAAARERIWTALAAIDAAHEVLRQTSSDLAGNDFRVDVAERLETQDRTNRGLMYRIFGELADPPDEDGSIAAVRSALWKRLRITPREITHRCRLATRIRPHRSLTGAKIPPELPALAAAVQAGAVGNDHIRAVCQTIDILPASVSPTEVAQAEAALLDHATRVDSGIVTKLGHRIADHLNPDGLFSDEDAHTGSGSRLPMRDLIAMAADAIHYLAVFDDHLKRPLYLGRQRRVATADQRLICYARDRGCTRPNCLVPGDHCEVHHSPDWAKGGRTDADKLHFACGCDHTDATDGHQQTIVTDTGRLGWTDGTTPPQINHAHHPEELLRGGPDPPA